MSNSNNISGNEKRSLLIESQFLPPLEFFSVLLSFDRLLIEKQESYIKQTYRNRCRILGSNGVLNLVLPVEHGVKNMKDIKLHYGPQAWNIQFWRTIKTCYNKAPFMEHYESELHDILLNKTAKLIDLNTRLLTFCLQKLQLSVEIAYTEDYLEEYKQEGIIDRRSVILPKQSYLKRDFYKEVPYFQQFGTSFEPNLSILDLLLNMGPEAVHILSDSSQSKKY